MTPEDRLEFCKVCHNHQFDFDRGITCKLTNDKPTFEVNCPDFDEMEHEARRRVRQQFKDDLGIKDLFEANSYPTSNWWIDFFRKRLPEKFEIKDSDYNKLIFVVLASIMIFGAFSTLEIVPIYKLLMLTVLAILVVIVIRTAWNQLVAERMTIAILDTDGIDILGHQRIEWENVIYVYVNATLSKVTIFIKAKDRKEPFPVKIDAGFSIKFFITLIEAYRKNKTGQTSPNIN